MIGSIRYLRPAFGHVRQVRYLTGEYGFACKVLGALADKIIVVLIHDDGSSSHYRIAVDGARIHETRESAQESWRTGREERKAARLAKRAARAEYRAACESDNLNRRNQERADKRALVIA